MLKYLIAAAATLALTCSVAAQTPAPPGPVDAAQFVDPVSARSGDISPSGAYAVYIGRDATREFVVVVDLTTHRGVQIQPLQSATGRYDWVRWKGDNKLIFSVHIRRTLRNGPETGSMISGRQYEEWNMARVFAMNRDGTGMVQMFQNQTNQLYYGYSPTLLLDDLPADASHVLIEAADNSGDVGVWRADVGTGAVEQIETGTDLTRRYWTDVNGAIVMRKDVVHSDSTNADEGDKFFRRAPGASAWTFVLQVSGAATATNTPDFDPVTAGPGPGKLYVFARSGGQDASALYLYDTATGEMGAPLQQSTSADVQLVAYDRVTRQQNMSCEAGARATCNFLDPVRQRNLAAIRGFFHGAAEISPPDTSDDGSKWLLYVRGPTTAGGYYSYDVATHDLEPVADSYPSIDRDVLSPTDVVNYDARDGAHLWMYVTARPGVSGPRPMVVMPHGGPEARDYYGYDAFAQFLASRGYVVIQPNFRGGSGFGRAFADAGRGQWGKRMQDDVTDAVHHMIDAGVADPHRICIVGASYGGYAALAGAALTPDLYKCAVSISGLSDLNAILRTSGPQQHLSTDFQYWRRSIGDPAANHDALVAVSPAAQAAHITAAVLLIHGDDDDNVPILQSELMQQALNSAGHPTRLVRLQGEGHYWDDWRTEDRLAVFRETEAFLAQYLGPSH